MSNNPLKDSTHIRYNNTKRLFNFFKNTDDWYIFNNGRGVWERYHGGLANMQVLMTEGEPLKVEPLYPIGSPTEVLLKQVDHYIPQPVLRELIDIYSNPDLDKITINLNIKYEKDISIGTSS